MRANTRYINFTRRERRREWLTHLEVREEALMEKNVDLDWLAMHFPAVSKTTAIQLQSSATGNSSMVSTLPLALDEGNYCLITLSDTVQSLPSFKSTIKSYLFSYFF